MSDNSGGDGFEPFNIGASDSNTIQDILACELTNLPKHMGLHVILQALFSTQSNENLQPASIPRGTRSISLSTTSLRDLARFVTVRTSDSAFGANIRIEEDGYEDEEEEDYNPEDQDDYAPSQQWFPPVKEPRKEGEELLHSGDFGRVGVKIRSRANNYNLMKSVLNRAAQPIPNLNKEDLLSVCSNSPYQNHELNWSLSPEPRS